MKTKHTPLPWDWDTESLIVKDSNGIAIAVILNREIRFENICTIEAEANAKLIAAAPDLLEALKNFVNHGSCFDEEQDMQQALVAILKATQ